MSYLASYESAVGLMLEAQIGGKTADYRRGLSRLEMVLREALFSAALYGSEQALARAAEVKGEIQRVQFSAIEMDVPDVTFNEALESFRRRTPTIIKDAAERTAKRISELYARGDVVAFVKAAEQAIADRAASYIDKAFAEGLSESDAVRGLRAEVSESIEPWSAAYAQTAFRTNINTAISAARFEQALDPDLRELVPAMRLDTAGDSDTRPNHQALDGMILRSDNSAWNLLAPPLGYNCRCTVVMVSILELAAMGMWDDEVGVLESSIPSDGGPDEGFNAGARPDIFRGL